MAFRDENFSAGLARHDELVNLRGQAGEKNSMEGGSQDYSTLLQGEFLNRRPAEHSAAAGGARGPAGSESPESHSFLSYSVNLRDPGMMNGIRRDAFSTSPLCMRKIACLTSPRNPGRKISQTPFKVLDAPNLVDDFYLNLVDWSLTNQLAVALNKAVYLWSACTSRVDKLCELPDTEQVTSVAWMQRGSHLAIGTKGGNVQIWDVQQSSLVRTVGGHRMRVGALAWNGPLLASGSRDHSIVLRDVRKRDACSQLQGHRQEVCGLKWSFDEQQLASGGNDNQLLVWNKHSTSPVLRFSDHGAAVKAIAWSPHQSGLLASGAGTADRCIRFWNTQTNSMLQKVDTGSQVCNLCWSKTVNEIVSTHGYSLNQVVIWKFPSMRKVATLVGHTYRVLYLAMSPDGQTVVTGAGDETLRFWKVFPSAKNRTGPGSASGGTGAVCLAGSHQIR